MYADDMHITYADKDLNIIRNSCNAIKYLFT